MCKFAFNVTTDLSVMLEKAKKGIQQAKGQLNENDGTFWVPTPLGTIHGKYTASGQTVAMEITSKPWLLSCGTIESKMREMLEKAAQTKGLEAFASEDSPFDRLAAEARASEGLRRTLRERPVETLRRYGILVEPQHEEDAPAVANLIAFAAQVPEAPVYFADADYARVEAGWLGLYIHLSSKAVADVCTGVNVAAGLSALIGTVSAPIPSAGPILTVIGAAIGGFLKLYSGIVGATDKGRGVTLFCSWVAPGVFIPSSR